MYHLFVERCLQGVVIRIWFETEKNVLPLRSLLCYFLYVYVVSSIFHLSIWFETEKKVLPLRSLFCYFFYVYVVSSIFHLSIFSHHFIFQNEETVNPGEFLAARCSYNTTGHHENVKIGRINSIFQYFSITWNCIKCDVSYISFKRFKIQINNYFYISNRGSGSGK